jgi:imidazole glycerol-phosphate synthase subunit HisF
MKLRIIPRLDIKGPNLVKGIHLEGLRVLGRPEDFTAYYYEMGADELIYQDVVASLYGRSSIHDLITRVARRTFIPLTVGGGLRSVDDMRQVLRCGADKVSINSAALADPGLISRAARAFGASTVVVTIEAIRQPDGRHLAFINNGREETGVEVVEWAARAESLGAGEILLTSVDSEGTGRGFNLQLVRAVTEAVSIPVVAHGGAGQLAHFPQVAELGVAAIACASVLHYDAILHQQRSANAEHEGNTTFLSSGARFGKVQPCSVQAIKEHLAASGFACRQPPRVEVEA